MLLYLYLDKSTLKLRYENSSHALVVETIIPNIYQLIYEKKKEHDTFLEQKLKRSD